jgi:hypothetical protein
MALAMTVKGSFVGRQPCAKTPTFSPPLAISGRHPISTSGISYISKKILMSIAKNFISSPAARAECRDGCGEGWILY